MPIIITNDSFGMGPCFRIREVESTQGKMLRGKYYRARKSRTTWCMATKALALEAVAINKSMEAINERARKLRDKIKEAQPNEQTNS